MHIGDLTDAVTVSIGGAMSPRHGRTERDLLDAAAHALRSATQASERYRLAE
jgi:predicted signal transduction protein with EAL and GGDEF domain